MQPVSEICFSFVHNNACVRFREGHVPCFWMLRELQLETDQDNKEAEWFSIFLLVHSLKLNPGSHSACSKLSQLSLLLLWKITVRCFPCTAFKLHYYLQQGGQGSATVCRDLLFRHQGYSLPKIPISQPFQRWQILKLKRGLSFPSSQSVTQ